MAAKQLMLPANRAFNSNGLAISGAQAKLYLSGGLTPANFFADSGLVTSLGSTLTANGAGRFPTAYGDSTVAYRLRTLDSDGAVLDDIDPYFFGMATGVDGANASIAVGTTTTGAAGSSASVSNSGTGTNAILNFTVPAGTNGTTGPAGDVAKATDRTALAAIAGQAAGATRFLVESGREGTFVWSSSNFVTTLGASLATVDQQQGVYVAPASDTTGASGAWVRKFSAPLDIRWFGAVADCTAVGVGTDNAAAITAAATLANALGNAGIFIPRGRFRVASRLAFTTGTKIVGEGFHENPGSANGTTYTGVNIYDGSILVFDADVGGMIFYEFTDNSNAGAVTFPADHKYKSARYSAARDFMLYGGGGVTVAPHGIEIRTVVTLENVRCDFFGGSGFHIEANTSGTNPYGIADGSKLTRCIARANKLHGFRANGNDANVIHFDSCDSANNGGAGYLDNGQLGNTYASCHAATNNQSNGAGTVWTTKAQTDAPALTDSTVGSYITSSGIGPHTFTGCYSETGSGTKHEIVSPSVIVGGNLAGTAGSASASATTFNGGGAITAMSLAPVPTFGTTLTSTHSVFTLAPGSGSPAIKVNPGSGSFSGLQLLGTSGSSTQGLDVSAGLGSVAYSSDTHIFRNAAQNVTFGTFSSAGLNLGAASALSFNGTTIINSSGVLQAAGTPAFTGDVTKSAGSLTTAIAANAVTYAKFQQVAASSLVGNATGSLANATGITLGSTLAFSAAALQTAALTGDVTASANSFATTIAANAVTFAKMQALSAGGKLLGSAVGSTAVAEITVGTGLTVGTSTLRFANISATTLLGNSTGGATTPGEITLAGGLAFAGTTLTAAGALTPTSVASTGAVTSSSATAGIGYATGAGGAVTQLTSKGTGATLSKVCGQVTMNSAALAANTVVSFTLTNTAIAAGDELRVWVAGGEATAGSYLVSQSGNAAGSRTICLRNLTAGSLSEAVVVGFLVNKAVTA